MARRRASILLLSIWVIAFGAALALDRDVAQHVASVQSVATGHPPFIDRLGRFARILKLPGYFPFTLLIAAMLWIFARRSRPVAVALVLSGPLVGVGYMLLKWSIGRHRPILGIAPFTFHPFAGGWWGLIHAERGLCFPSGHTALAFATATCLTIARPRWAALFLPIATAVAVERVLENAHYLSDVVAGAGMGVVCGWAAIRLTASLFQERPQTGFEVITPPAATSANAPEIDPLSPVKH